MVFLGNQLFKSQMNNLYHIRNMILGLFIKATDIKTLMMIVIWIWVNKRTNFVRSWNENIPKIIMNCWIIFNTHYSYNLLECGSFRINLHKMYLSLKMKNRKCGIKTWNKINSIHLEEISFEEKFCQISLRKPHIIPIL